MTYNVFSGTLNPTHSLLTVKCVYLSKTLTITSVAHLQDTKTTLSKHRNSTYSFKKANRHNLVLTSPPPCVFPLLRALFSRAPHVLAPALSASLALDVVSVSPCRSGASCGQNQPVNASFIFMVALCNRADHYIFALWFLSSFFFSSAVRYWMFTILLHMAWPYCEFRMQVRNVLHADC